MKSESSIKENLDAIHYNIACAAKFSGRSLEDITLVGITKFCPTELIVQAWNYGQKSFGENYVQEALKKQEELVDLSIEWHFTGRIQTNKAKYLAGHFAYIHTVDSIEVAEALHRRMLDTSIPQNILVQVNIGDEPQKAGILEHSLQKLTESILSLSKINLCGLMCLPPACTNGEDVRVYFSKLRELRDNLVAALGKSLPVLSMGMSSDYVQAIEEGATCIRVGTGIFGQRRHK